MDPYVNAYDGGNIKIDKDIINTLGSSYSSYRGTDAILEQYKKGCEMNILKDWYYLEVVNYIESDPRSLALLKKWIDQMDKAYAKFGKMCSNIIRGENVAAQMDALYKETKYQNIATELAKIMKGYNSKVIRKDPTIKECVATFRKAQNREITILNNALKSQQLKTNKVLNYNWFIVYTQLIGDILVPHVWNLSHSIWVKIE